MVFWLLVASSLLPWPFLLAYLPLPLKLVVKAWFESFVSLLLLNCFFHLFFCKSLLQSLSNFRSTPLEVMFKVSINFYKHVVSFSMSSSSILLATSCSWISLIFSKCFSNEVLSSIVIENNMFFRKKAPPLSEVSCRSFNYFQISAEVFPIWTSRSIATLLLVLLIKLVLVSTHSCGAFIGT